jgi:hypothetical protein
VSNWRALPIDKRFNEGELIERRENGGGASGRISQELD